MRRYFGVLAVVCAVAAGCGDSGGAGGVRAERRARLVFETGGYIPPVAGVGDQFAAGGMFALGDIDSDGYTDMAVSSGLYPGYFAAYSGKDGSELWRVSGLVGKAAEAAGENGYSIKEIFLAGDVNKDGVRDIFFQDDWSRRRVFLISGADGSKIADANVERVAAAIRSDDFTGDGVPDIVCYHGITPGARIFSGADLSEAALHEQVIDLAELNRRAQWIMGRFPDLNADGIDEFAVGYGAGDHEGVVFLSGADFKELSRIKTDWDKVTGSRSYASAGDLSGDGVPDLVKASKCGRDKEGMTSYLAAYSGADGATLWEVLGTELPGGPKSFMVDAKTGARTDLPGDIEFGDRIAAVPDRDGDGIDDIATILPAVVRSKTTRGVLVFSGATGAHIATYVHEGKDFSMLGGDNLVVVESADGKGTPGVAVAGKVSDKKYGVAVFTLERVKR